MQLIYRYLVNNKVLLTVDLAGEITEYKSVYQRNIKIYRGIDNLITFQLNNADQKAISIDTEYTPTFYMYDENNTLVVTKQGTIIETQDSSVYTNKGHQHTMRPTCLLRIPKSQAPFKLPSPNLPRPPLFLPLRLPS